jgi:hypothetical protein
MEPALHTGDLVLTVREPSYKVGDSVLTSVMGGYVLHRVVKVDHGVLRTRGINNGFTDSWRVKPSEAVGRLVTHIDGAGNWLVFLRTKPVFLGGIAAVLTLLLSLEWHPRKSSKRLKTLLDKAQLEHPQAKRDSTSALAVAFFVLTIVSLLATAMLLATEASFYPRIALCLAGSLVALICFEAIGSWLANGGDLEEPYRSFAVLGNRLYKLNSNVEIPGPTQSVNSAAALSKLAEISNSPVLHTTEQNGLVHEFTLVTDEFNYLWRTGPSNEQTYSERSQGSSRHKK